MSLPKLDSSFSDDDNDKCIDHEGAQAHFGVDSDGEGRAAANCTNSQQFADMKYNHDQPKDENQLQRAKQQHMSHPKGDDSEGAHHANMHHDQVDGNLPRGVTAINADQQ